MRIYTDPNGLAVNAISRTPDGTGVEGHLYQVLLPGQLISLEFQLGTVPAVGVNGLTNEALLAVLMHRMGVLQGKFPCDENGMAILALETAQKWLELRTKNRQARGVEGKHVL